MIAVTVAGLEDWARVRAVRLAALADAPEAFLSTLAEEAERPEERWRAWIAGASVLLATSPTWAARDVGMAAVSDAWDGPVDHLGLYAVWVAPEARRAGVGQALVRAAIAEAARRGASCLRLEVGVENAAASGLYLRCGFAPTGRTTRLAPPRRHQVERELAIDPRPRAGAVAPPGGSG